MRKPLAALVLSFPDLAFVQQWSPVPGYHDKDFAITCSKGNEVVLRIGPERTDARRYARDIYLLHLPGGDTEWHFMRGRTSSDTPETFVPASDVSCDETAL